MGPQEGYFNTIDCLEKVFDQLTANTLCRYATVSRYYGKLDVYNFAPDGARRESNELRSSLCSHRGDPRLRRCA